MSRETEKFLKEISKQFEKGDYNNLDDGFDYTDEMKSDDILDQAYESNSKSRARELAKKALIIYPDNIDAMVFLADFESTEERKLIKYNKIIDRASELLKKDNYFEDSVGYFWGIIETRPYLRAKAGRIRVLLNLEKYDEAIKECEDILRLNNHDNMGIRYTLMNLYCLLGKYDELNIFYKKYKEETAYMLFPLAIMYYKQGKKEKLLKILKDLNKCNKYIIDLLIGKCKKPNKYPEYYSFGSIEEAVLVIEAAEYLLKNNQEFINFVSKEYSKYE